MQPSYLRRLHWLAAFVFLSATLAWSSSGSSDLQTASQDVPPRNLKIAFIGDGGLGPNSEAVLNLIKSEGASAALHSGDLEYTNNPAAWEAQLNNILGPDF